MNWVIKFLSMTLGVLLSASIAANGLRPRSFDNLLKNISSIVVVEVVEGHVRDGSLPPGGVENKPFLKTYTFRIIRTIAGEEVPRTFEDSSRRSLSIGARYLLLLHPSHGARVHPVVGAFQLERDRISGEFDRVRIDAEELIAFPPSLSAKPIDLKSCGFFGDDVCHEAVIYSYIPLPNFIDYAVEKGRLELVEKN